MTDPALNHTHSHSFFLGPACCLGTHIKQVLASAILCDNGMVGEKKLRDCLYNVQGLHFKWFTGKAKLKPVCSGVAFVCVCWEWGLMWTTVASALELQILPLLLSPEFWDSGLVICLPSVPLSPVTLYLARKWTQCCCLELHLQPWRVVWRKRLVPV